VLKPSTYSTVLVLDWVNQVTKRDAYQEIITHIPLFAHKNPQKVLMIGDRAVLREVCKHPGVTEIHTCAIDRQV